ncbi:MAG: Crp/Fnr family transcriptional regulator [Candidatus Sericytochromatia bacterium]
MSTPEENAAYHKALAILGQQHGRIYELHDRIFSEGEPGDKVYFIVSGSVNVFIGGGMNRRELWTLVPGDIFGEMALLDQLERTASVEAGSRTHVVALDRDRFNHLIGKHPILAQKVIELMGQRMRKMDAQFKIECGYVKGQQMGQFLKTFEFASIYANEVDDPQKLAPMDTLPEA